jgi:hypothetical protein
MTTTDLSARQNAYYQLIAAASRRILDGFDFDRAIKYGLALKFGWIGIELQQAKQAGRDINFDLLVVRAREMIRDLMATAIRHAVKNIERPDFAVAYTSTGGFNVIVRRDGIVHLFFSPVDYDSYDMGNLDELYAAHDLHESEAAARGAVQPQQQYLQAVGRRLQQLNS